jgi:hypothetical protein
LAQKTINAKKGQEIFWDGLADSEIKLNDFDLRGRGF